ncbi:unnamed protein product [Ectocarpus sp. CCAP 1310/34]|nr:unnamed protein product [Ectocarpus sp. CCAP 1310/34]
MCTISRTRVFPGKTKNTHLETDETVECLSPILACTSGFGITLRYTLTMYGLVVGNLEILNVVGFPALWIAEIALIMTALRLFVMYYPSTRAKYGRVTREKPWTCGLAATYLLVETVVWLAAAAQGIERNIRPIQEVLYHARRNGIPKGVQMLLALSSRARRRSTSTIGGEEVTSDVTQNPSQHSREPYIDSNRLAGIMNYLPLREAFGEFCQKSLCSESFQFLLDASEFRGVIVEGPVDGDANGSAEEENEAPTRRLGDVATMVNEYIKDGAPSEINIGSDTKHDIMELAKAEAFASLDQDARKLIFVKAEREIKRILEDNLMARFLVSAQYKRAVDGDGDGRV